MTAAALQRTPWGSRGAGETSFCSRVACCRLAMKSLRPQTMAYAVSGQSTACVIVYIRAADDSVRHRGFLVHQRHMLSHLHRYVWFNYFMASISVNLTVERI